MIIITIMVYSQHFHKNGSTSVILNYKIYSISDWICKDMAMEISLILGNVC